MKYIIDILDKAIDFMGGRDHVSVFVEPEIKVGDCKHYALRISKEDIEPYTELDRKAIENEVWDFARNIVFMDYDNIDNCFGTDYLTGSEALDRFTYQEAKAKFEAWLKQKDEIRVGDEVIYNSRTRAVVLEPETEKRYGEIFTSEGSTIVVSHDDLEKTGRHFPEVGELLKKMRQVLKI